jgi:hypothetical protein
MDIVLGVVGAVFGGWLFGISWSEWRDGVKHLQRDRHSDRGRRRSLRIPRNSV